MSSSASDRNLLFGVLALQMDFITRETLIAAVSTWVLDKTRLIEDILVQQGAMTEPRRAILESLVTEHIKAHDDDTHKSLASTGLSYATRSVREELSSVDDLDVIASLATLDSIATRTQEFELDAIPWPSVGTSTSSGQRFRFLRPHDSGGLGVVSVAIDEELNREVALKEIREQHADDPEKRARFLIEAEITGALEHPGIVPVYGLGHYNDGRPYYAMRFIKGDSLKHAIIRFHKSELLDRDSVGRALELRELLGRFVDVCNTLAYAHSRGVLHRDVKPANIMLGPFGETLVVDWGLAKAAGQPEDSTDSTLSLVNPASAKGRPGTMMGSAIGTPAYMSPEQAEGKLDQLGPASDVYSLGATLYQILTGAIPFNDTDHERMIQKVIRGEFTSPRQVNPSVPQALEAVCLKAMALDPESRYRSSLELAEDLKHWLAGEAVTAFREPWPARAARWSRKHRTTVAGLASLLVTAVVALTISTVLLGHEKQQTEKQRQLADKRFRQARETADGFLTRITNDSQLAEPGFQKLRQRLLEAGVSYYENFAREGVDPGDFARLAEVSKSVAQINSQVGSTTKALASSLDAVTYYEKVAQSRPDDPSTARPVALALLALSDVQATSGSPTDALRSLAKAREIGERLVVADPGEKSTRLLASINLKLGIWHQKALDKLQAAEFFQKAVALCEQIEKAAPNSIEAKSDLAEALYELGVIQIEMLRPELARDAFDRSRKLREDVLSQRPNDSKQLDNLATLDEAVAQILNTKRQFAEALSFLKRARDRREALIADNSVPGYQAGLGEDYEEISKDERFLNNLGEALRAGERARAIAGRLVLFHQDVPRFLLLLGRAELAIGKVQVASKQEPQARISFETAIKILKTPEIVGSGESSSRRYLVDALTSFGKLNSGERPVPVVIKKDEALASLQEANGILRQLVIEKPKDADLKNNLATSGHNLGSLKELMGDLDDAARLYRESTEIREKVISAYPDDMNARIGIAASFNNLAILLANRNEKAAAVAPLQEAIKHQKVAFKAAPQNAPIRQNLTAFYKRLADLQRTLNQPEAARETEKEGQALLSGKP